MMLNVTRFNHAADFLDVAGEALYQNEALNCLMIGIVTRLAENPGYYSEHEPYLGVVSRDGEVILASTMTPPFGLLVVPLAEEAWMGLPLLVAGLIREGISPPDVHAVQPYGRQFAEVWAARTGGSFELEMAQRIYTLLQVTPPQGVPGEFLQAGSEHADLVTAWFQNFEAEALQAEPPPFERLYKSVSERIAAGDWFLWQDQSEVVSMCLRTRPTRSGCSIAGVYTPPEKRGKGYASACVAALSQRLLDSGFSFTSLFTDLANPTSNQIYMNIGYQPLADFDKYRLGH
jgi:RimJ/RimL family protein N-acetyltransferase